MEISDKVKKIPNKYKKTDKQPEEVWAQPAMDELRRSYCLCNTCGSGHKGTDECLAALEFLALCQKYDCALAMTRCGVTDSEGNLLYKPL
jgi:hypothetical protein